MAACGVLKPKYKETLSKLIREKRDDDSTYQVQPSCSILVRYWSSWRGLFWNFGRCQVAFGKPFRSIVEIIQNYELVSFHLWFLT